MLFSGKRLRAIPLIPGFVIAFAAMSLVTSGPLWARTKAKTARRHRPQEQ